MKEKKWQVLAHRNDWIVGAKITESESLESGDRHFTATIRGWHNWKIWEGNMRNTGNEEVIAIIRKRVIEIRDRIDSGDEVIFKEPNEYIK